jgi:hypothetical protein
MVPYAASTHTLLSVKVLGDSGDDSLLERSGLWKLVNPTRQWTEKERNALEDMLNTLLKCFQAELLTSWEKLGLEEKQEFEAVSDAEFRQSRFDTVVSVRPAPHLDAWPEDLVDMQNTKKIFVKDFVVPGEHGLWVRLFESGKDKRGRLLKLEKDTILGIPFTITKEFGRINHIEGNRHYVIRMMVTPKPATWRTEALPKHAEPLTRFYPHFSKGIAELKEKTEGPLKYGWDKHLHTVNRQKLKCVQLPRKLSGDLKELKTEESSWFDD